MGRKVVIGFFLLVAVFIGVNLIVVYSTSYQTAPYFRAQVAAEAHQTSILASGVLDSVSESSDENERLALLAGALDPTARDVRGAPLTLERATLADDMVAVDMRSAGRDGVGGTDDDVVILVSFARADGLWCKVHRVAIEQHGKRIDFDLKTGREAEPQR